MCLKRFPIICTILAVCFLSVPAMATQNLLTLALIPCNGYNCDQNPPASDPLTSGTVKVDTSGVVTATLVGAAANSTYTVFVGVFAPNIFFPSIAGDGICSPGDGSVGTLTTDAIGNFNGQIATLASLSHISQINFAFNSPACIRTQFTSGIVVP